MTGALCVRTDMFLKKRNVAQHKMDEKAYVAKHRQEENSSVTTYIHTHHPPQLHEVTEHSPQAQQHKIDDAFASEV